MRERRRFYHPVALSLRDDPLNEANVGLYCLNDLRLVSVIRLLEAPRYERRTKRLDASDWPHPLDLAERGKNLKDGAYRAAHRIVTPGFRICMTLNQSPLGIGAPLMRGSNTYAPSLNASW